MPITTTIIQKIIVFYSLMNIKKCDKVALIDCIALG